MQSSLKMLQDGWIMAIDIDGITMQQLEEEIIFNSIVKTSKGAHYCGYLISRMLSW